MGENFTISGQPNDPLYPGAQPQLIALTVSNPNTVPIYVTQLIVSVAGEPAGCPSVENVRITQSDASPASPLVVPAGAEVILPAQGISAPSIELADLEGANQDGCKGATFPLSYTGSAHS